MRVRKRIATIAIFLLFLCGCGNTELEDREFPTLLTVSDEADFASEWLNGLQQGIKKLDYNHLKVIVIEQAFIENEERMAEMLALLKDDKNVPLNAYIVVTKSLKELVTGTEQLDEPLGDYLEKLLEHGDTVKKETYPTIGMFYQEDKNRKETLFVPIVALVEEKPEVTSYEVYKRGVTSGTVKSDVALLSFFIGNQLEEYLLQLGEEHYVRLSNSENEISFQEKRESSGLLRRQVVVDISCDGKILKQTYNGKKEAVEEGLDSQIKAYMTGKAKEALENGIDVTNSFKKLGEEREWYQYYTRTPDFYEGEIEILFEMDIDWVD